MSASLELLRLLAATGALITMVHPSVGLMLGGKGTPTLKTLSAKIGA
jgi:hypothetical protein